MKSIFWWIKLYDLLLYARYYTPIAFDERVTFWLQRAWSLPCACAFAAFYAGAIA